MKRILCVHLKSWPIDRIRRRYPAFQLNPLALVQTVMAKQRVVDVCPLARSAGVRPGITLAEGRALCADLCTHASDPDKDARALEALGRWLIRFTPVVAVQKPDALFLDVGGSERLFGGLDPLLKLVRASLERFQIQASSVIAPTPGAAWALARAGDFIKPDSRPISAHAVDIHDDEAALPAVLAPLPVDCLRLDTPAINKLHRTGIETIGQLLRLPRSVLPSRFGQALLDRIDQALGKIPEPLLALQSTTPVQAGLELDYAVDSLEAIWLILGRLLDEVVAELARRGRGARQLQVRFSRPYQSPLELPIQLSLASRDRTRLFNLLRCAMETLQTDTGFDAIRIVVLRHEPLVEAQISLLEQDHFEIKGDYAHLIERLQIRLGDNAVVRPEWVESYVPERSWVSLPVSQPGLPERPAGRAPAKMPVRATCRPLCLRPAPVEIRVMVSPSEDREGRPVAFTHQQQTHRLRLAKGPERIAGEWWQGRYKTRDYFEVEDDAGQRFWIFRVLETFKWYLHGAFD